MTPKSRPFEILPSETYASTTAVAPAEDESKPKKSTGALGDFFNHNKGLFIIAVSQFFFSLMELSVKVLTTLDEPVPMFEVVAIRMVITYLACQIYMHASGVADPVLGPRSVRTWLVLRGLFGFTGLFGLYYSPQYMSLSDATTLTFLAPTVTAAFGLFFLQEPVSWKQGVAGRVIMIAKPTFIFGRSNHTNTGADNGPIVSEAQRLLAVGVSLVGVLGAACAYISIRIIGKRAHPMHLMTYYAIWSVVISVGAMYATNTEWVLPRQPAWSATLIIVGICGFIAQLLLTFGLQLETASRGSMVFYIQIVFALAFERIAFGTSPSGLSTVGIFVIIASAIYVALNKPTTEPAEPVDAESAVTWDVAHDVEEARGLLDGDESQEDIESDSGTPERHAHRSTGRDRWAQN